MRLKFEPVAKLSVGKLGKKFCLELDKKTGTFRLAWRGTKRSKDGFILRPAEFDFYQLSKLLIKAYPKLKDAKFRRELRDFSKKLYRKIK